MIDANSSAALFDLALGQLGTADAAHWSRRLAADAELTAAYNRCRNLLAPLAADAEHERPPHGLALRTLAAVAEVLAEQSPARRPPSLPAAQPKSVPWLVRRWAGRETPVRLDVVLAASIAFIVVGLGLGAIGKLRREQQVVACREDLRAVHAALIGYAGLLADELIRSGQYDPSLHAACPARQAETGDVRTATFSYTLGYRLGETGPVKGINLRSPGVGDLTPIAADPAPRRDGAEDRFRSVHGSGQNVLLLGGSVRFLAGTTLGVNRDDIYKNDRDVVRAGLRADDISLGGPNDLP